jgi:arginine:pyruvate transaminase
VRFSSLVARVSGEGSKAWEIHHRARARKARGEDVILLSIGDPDFETPEPIVDRAIHSLRNGRTHYTPPAGTQTLRDTLAGYHQATTGQSVTSDQVVVVPGAQCGLFSALLCTLDAGDEVISPQPMYVTYEATVGASGARVVKVPLRSERRFHVDPEEIEEAVTPKTRAVLLNTPHNPTGAVLTREEVQAVAEICSRHDLWLICDEVYASLTFDQPHISPAGLPGMATRSVTVSSLSKSHAMTGWRLGWVVAPRELAAHLTNLSQCMLYGCPPFIQDAAVLAVEEQAHACEAMRSAYRRRCDLVVRRLSHIDGIECHRPEAGLYVMIDVRQTNQSAMEFGYGLLDDQGVALLPADAFGPGMVGHLRLSLSASDELLADACERIARYVERSCAEGGVGSMAPDPAAP